MIFIKLAELKELEDLKHIRDNLESQLIKKRNDDLKSIVNKAADDFVKYFQEQNFQVKVDNLTTSACYNDLMITLKKQNPNEEYMGIYYVFEMQLPNKDKYDVVINPKKQRPNPSVSIKHGKPSVPSFNDEKSKVKEDIEIFESQIENYSNDYFGLYLRAEANVMNPYADIVFGSMYDLLSNIFE